MRSAPKSPRAARFAPGSSPALGASTRKGLADALPEFEKYLPADEPAAVRSLPVVANVVADFVKAGWPKGKQPARAAAAA